MSTYDMSSPGYQQCRAILLRTAEDWTELLTGFETGPRGVTHRAALEMAVGIVRKFTCPLFTDDSVAQEMFLLSQAVKTLDNLTLFGSWDDEDDEVFAARTEEERIDKAQQDVDFTVYRLLTGLDPCTDCVTRWDFTAWKPSVLRYARCEDHLALYRAERDSIMDSRPEHGMSLLRGGQ